LTQLSVFVRVSQVTQLFKHFLQTKGPVLFGAGPFVFSVAGAQKYVTNQVATSTRRPINY
jgi:hypothetical protein